jgi:membrane fusion protein (multidrug efflux system)
MASTSDPREETGAGTSAAHFEAGPADETNHSANPANSPVSHSAHRAVGPAAGPPSHATPTAPTPRSHPVRKWLLIYGFIAALAVGGYFMYPSVLLLLNTISTDDAYVNSHVTYVAPRVAGQVTRVLVDDNYRVKKGALLVQLDKEPYQVQLAIRKAAVSVAETDLTAAEAQVRSLLAMGKANRYRLEHSIEDVHTQVANLRANVATLESKKATLALAQANLRRGDELAPSGGISKEELDQRRETVKVDEAAVEQALQAVYATRVSLGLEAQPGPGHNLTEVPKDLDQTFSSVRQALGQLLESVTQFGYTPASWEASPKQALAEFYKQDPTGDIDKIVSRIIPSAPGVKQAKAKLLQARADLDQALLNLRYCDISSEIDGVVTRRNVNPGNNVAIGQNLMAVRSLTEIWVDCNFKETQLADLRIGQRVRCDIDMYGSRREYEGRITGFTMGTGQTLALLPPQNATGNFVKIVQRLPVRVELTDYDPVHNPLFVGLSVVPYVYYKERPVGKHAGEVLQPLRELPEGPTAPIASEPPQSAAPAPGRPSTGGSSP